MKKILVINNDIDTMQLLKKWLEKNDYKATFTGKPDDVKMILKEFKPDLSIIDILRKDTIDIIKKHKKSLPVILMTGYAKVEPTNDLEVNDIIEKPFNLKVLEQKIKKFI